MANITIYLSLVSGTTNLHLSDSEGHDGDGTITTDASPGDNVTWQVANGANISSIDNIYDKQSNNVFSSGPSQDSSTVWSGTVSNSATGTESYGIKYTVNGVQYDDDPEIKISN